jgi:flagellin-like hook-associated protein FlgL
MKNMLDTTQIKRLESKIKGLEQRIEGLKDYISMIETRMAERLESLEVFEKHCIREGIV